MTTIKNLTLQFKKADFSEYPDVTRYEKALDAGLWVLWVHKEKLGQENYLTAGEIRDVLRSLGASFKEIELIKAFARADKKVDVERINNKSAYKIMRKGIDYLKSSAGGEGVAVYFIEGNQPRTDRKKLEDVVTKTKGEIKIVDKFYSRESLDMIEKFAQKSKIAWLTASISRNEDETKFKSELSRFKSQYKHILIRKHAKEYELHDRYIVTDDALILFGHGLIDLGRKESFILVFKDDTAKEIRSLLSARFDEKWQKASNL